MLLHFAHVLWAEVHAGLHVNILNEDKCSATYAHTTNVVFVDIINIILISVRFACHLELELPLMFSRVWACGASCWENCCCCCCWFFVSRLHTLTFETPYSVIPPSVIQSSLSGLRKGRTRSTRTWGKLRKTLQILANAAVCAPVISMWCLEGLGF